MLHFFRRWRLGFGVILGVIVLGGCAKIRHLDQLLTLKAVSDEQQSLGHYVQVKDERFESLLVRMCSGDFPSNWSGTEVSSEFGAPIHVSHLDRDSVAKERWLYRRQTRYFKTPTVTLDFDTDGRLVAHDVSGCPPSE